MAHWLDIHDTDGSTEFRLTYAGADTEKFLSAARSLPKRCSVEALGHVGLDQLHARMRTATINLHLYFSPVLFHHKLFELIAANRPILCFPGESDEAQNIADETGARLYRCATGEQLLAALDQALGSDGTDKSAISAEKLSRYSWDGQAEILEDVLRQVIQ